MSGAHASSRSETSTQSRQHPSDLVSLNYNLHVFRTEVTQAVRDFQLSLDLRK